MATIPASDNEFPKVLLTEGAAPAAPAANLVEIYAKADGLPYTKDDAGAESPMTPNAHIADTTAAHAASAVSVDPTGLSVVAGTDVQTAIEELDAGIAGGGIPVTTIDAKGDILGGTGADAIDNLTVGADGTQLEALASAATGLAWKGARGVLAAANAVTSAGTSGVDQAQAFAGADLFDSDAFHDPASNNTRLTVPTGLGGLYLVVAHASFASNATGRRTFTIRKNGTTSVAFDRRTADASGSTLHNITALAVLAATDYVELIGNQTSGGALDMQATNTFGMFRIGV